MSHSADTAIMPQFGLKEINNNTEHYETDFNIDGGSNDAAHLFVFTVQL